MNSLRKILPALFTCLLATTLVGFAQTSKVDEKAAPPTYSDIPIPAVLKNRISDSVAELKRGEAKAFQAGLTYVKGVPVLMMITEAGEAAEKGADRRLAIMAAFDFLLDDTAFDLARVCVVEINKGNPDKQKISNYEIKRAQYQDAAKRASKDTLAKSASAKIKTDRVLVELVATELGIK